MGGCMIVLTGPQSTPDDLVELTDLADAVEVPLCAGPDQDWLSVTHLVCAPGWDACPIAAAHVTVASAFGVAVVRSPLTVAVTAA